MAKKTASFTIDEQILEKFNQRCKEQCINKSQLVEKLIEDYLRT